MCYNIIKIRERKLLKTGKDLSSMKEVAIIKYMAEDGTKFDTKEQCIEYENSRKEAKSLKRALLRLRDICADEKCDNCPFYDGDCNFQKGIFPEDWTLFIM